MEPRFAIGRAPSRRATRPRQPRRRPAQSTTGTPLPFTFSFTAPNWFLLPPDGRAIITSNVRQPLVQLSSLTAAFKYFAEIQTRTPPFPATPFSKQMRALLGKSSNPFGPPSKEFLEDTRDAILSNMRFRTAMRGLLARWLRSQLKPANDEDLVTLAPPLRPVRIVDWAQRRMYSFEARTIYKDCVERLLLHDELWTTPSAPRNPYTNLPLSLGQLHSVVEQLRLLGYSHWTLNALRGCQYDLTTFKRKFAESLSYAAVDAVFRDPDSEDCKTVLLDFLGQEFEQHGAVFCRSVYLWALEHLNDCTHLMEWRKICKLYHTLTIQYKDTTTYDNQITRQIDPVTQKLCQPNLALRAAYRIWQTQQLRSNTAIRLRVSTLSPG